MTGTVAHDPPFHAEHIGSLLRPTRLIEAYHACKAGDIDADTLEGVQNDCILDVVHMQEAIGLKVITDGEFRRTSYISHFVDAVDGLDFAPSSFSFYSNDGATHDFVAPHVTGRVRRIKDNTGREFDFLRSVTDRTPKITLPSPATMHFLCGAKQPHPDIYACEDDFFADLAAAYREDIADLAARGATYVQLDDVPFAMLCDSRLRSQLAANGRDPEILVDRYIELTNACIEGLPAGVTAGLHICRGNLKGTWLAQGSYAAVARKVFQRVGVAVFCLEYDTPRAGDFAPLSAVPDDKIVILGLISTKVPQLEDPEHLKARILEANVYMPLDRLGVSPQCGFSSAVVGNPVTEADQVAKLGMIVEIAREVWGD